MATVVGDLVVFLRANTMQFDKGMAAASSRLTAVGKRMTRVGSMMTMKLSLPMAVAGGAAIKMAMDFETSMQQIVGLVGVAQEQVNEWREDIIRLGPSLSKTSTELGRAMFFITSAGLRGSTALNALEASAKGAAAGLGETEDVADAATSAMNAYGEANLSAEMAVSVLVATVREGKAAASSLAPVLGRIIPIAAELGVEFHEVGGAMAVMTRLGLNAEESATALRSTLATILKPTKQAEMEMSKYGMSMLDLKKVLREEGLIALLTKLRDTFGDNEESMQKVFRNVRALNGVLSIVGKNVDNNVKIFKSLASTTTNDLNKAFLVASETAKFKLNASLADVQNTFIKMGDLLMPTIIPAIQTLGGAFKSVTVFLDKLNPAQRTLAVNMGLAAVAAAPLSWAFGKVALTAGAATAAVGRYNIAVAAAAPATVAATTAMGGYSVAAGVGAAATAASAASTAAATAGVATLGTTLLGAATVVTTFTLALGALAALVGFAIGTYFRPFIESVTLLDKAFWMVANKGSDVTDMMLKNNDVWDNATHTLDRLKKSLGLQGKEWEYVNKQTRTNAERVQMLTDKAINLNKKRREELEIIKEVQTVDERAKEVQKRALEAMPVLLEKSATANERRLAALKEELGLYTSGDIEKALDGMVAQYEDMKGMGIDNNQLADEFGDKMLEWLKLAKENKVAIPAGVKAMGDDLEGKVNPAINKMLVHWKEFHHDARATGKILEGIKWSATGENAAAALGGGFKKGIDDGIKHGDVEFGKWVKRIEETPLLIKPQISLEGWNQAVQDALDGRIPDTTG